MVLELGCGYGRIFSSLKSEYIIGIDTSFSSLLMGKSLYKDLSDCYFIVSDALYLPFGDCVFDAVLCIQNGISSFHVDKNDLIGESIRVCKSDGVIMFSTYSDKFWDERLRWFEIQSAEGLLGEIDYERTKNGEIVCKDGFTATTVGPDEFLSLTSNFNVDVEITEVDESSLFCIIKPS
jgi:2-polyprenyl-6-hydroxyphenyl methylase/3-demethylubiquinone-9 3-methyltransferase